MVTSELADGARFAELASWPQDERDLAAETIYRFVFRSLYELHAFNGDPHPGNYLFHGGGRVTFLDFGLVKHFTADGAASRSCRWSAPVRGQRPRGVPPGHGARPGFLRPDAPLSTPTGGRAHGRVLRHRPGARPLTMTGDYASAVVRRFFDVRSPVAAYARIPRSYVILQRINLGLFALLGELTATANWRAIAEEIWPFVQGPPSTPMGEAEAGWRPGPGRSARTPGASGTGPRHVPRGSLVAANRRAQQPAHRGRIHLPRPLLSPAAVPAVPGRGPEAAGLSADRAGPLGDLTGPARGIRADDGALR